MIFETEKYHPIKIYNVHIYIFLFLQVTNILSRNTQKLFCTSTYQITDRLLVACNGNVQYRYLLHLNIFTGGKTN